MADHPNKHIREAIRYAIDNGWLFEKAGPWAHIFGKLLCPLRTRDGHHFHVHSTPRHPEIHARRIRRAVNQCNHE